MDATRMREGLIKGEFTCEDLIKVFSDRCHRIGRGHNLTAQENFLGALRMAKERDEELQALKDEGEEAMEERLGLLHGIPIAVKDCIY